MSSTVRRLLLLRHAKSDWYSGARSDFSRPLNQRGMRDGQAMGAWYAATYSPPARIACSPALRARETLQRFCAGGEWQLDTVTRFHESLYHAGLDDLREVIADYADALELMIIGHNPGLEMLLEWLVGSDLNRLSFRKLMPTAGFYRVTTACPLDALTAGCAQIEAHQRPRLLASD